MKLPREQYLALKRFKKEVNSQRANSLTRDHSGNLYRTDENGSIRRCTRDDLVETIKESTPGIVSKRRDTFTDGS